MRNYKLTISYDGGNYKGWQRLSGDVHTIQEQLEIAISKVVGYAVLIDAAGRTDAGVHARGQVANVKLSGKVEEVKLKDELNEVLPVDIKIIDVTLVRNKFHSRKSATAKQYTYTVDRGSKANVFSRKYSYHFPHELDVNKMRESCELLVGTHDYTAFCDKKDEKNHVRTIYGIRIEEEGALIKFHYCGSGFLNHMVRILTGTLLQIGSGYRDVESIPQIIKGKKRAEAGFLAPANGLCLEEVRYER